MKSRLVILVAVLVVAAVAGAIAIRAATTLIVEDATDPIVTVECSGWTGVTDECGAWGQQILDAGPPTTTFELGDVVRLRFDRGMLGFAPSCSVEYYLGRYPDEVAWTAEVACP